MKHSTLRRLTFAAALAALYAAITVLSAPFAYGSVQFRIAEAMAVLCCFTPTAIWGMTLGCVIANLFSTVTVFDILIGSAATLLACLLTRRIRKPALVPLPTILCNAVLVGAQIAFFTPDTAFFPAFVLNAATVGLGEAAVLYLLGVPLYLWLRRSRFGEELRKL